MTIWKEADRIAKKIPTCQRVTGLVRVTKELGWSE